MLAEARDHASDSAYERLRDAKSLFVRGQSRDPSSGSTHDSAPAPIPPSLSLPTPRPATANATATQALRTPNIVSLSSICRPAVRDSDVNSSLSWRVAMTSVLGAVPHRSLPLQGNSSRLNSHVNTNSRTSTTRSSFGNGEQNDMALYDAHVRSNAARMEEVRRVEKAHGQRVAAVTAEITRYIAQSAKLTASLALQRRILFLETQKPIRVEAIKAQVMETTKTGPLSVQKRAGLGSPATFTPFVNHVSDKKCSGAQFALTLLKSRFTRGIENTTRRWISSPPAQLPTSYVIEPQECGKQESPYEKREKVERGGGATGMHSDKTTLHTSSAFACVRMEPTAIYHSHNDDSPCAVPPQSIESIRSEAHTNRNPTSDMSVEEQRAIELLTTVRALRSQTEELLVTVLHATGAWGCWDDGAGEHGDMRGFFLPPQMAARVVREESAFDARLMQGRAAEEPRGAGRAVTTALMRLRPFRRVLPPPPPVAVQLEMFHRKQWQQQQEEQEQEQQQRAKCSVGDQEERQGERSCEEGVHEMEEAGDGSVMTPWRPRILQMLLPRSEGTEEDGDGNLVQCSKDAMPTRAEQDAYLEETLTKLKKSASALVRPRDTREESAIEQTDMPTRAEAQIRTSITKGETTGRVKSKRSDAKHKTRNVKEESKEKKIEKMGTKTKKHTLVEALNMVSPAKLSVPNMSPDMEINTSREGGLENSTHTATLSISSTHLRSRGRAQVKKRTDEQRISMDNLPLQSPTSSVFFSSRSSQRERASVETAVQAVFHAEHTRPATNSGRKGGKGFIKGLGSFLFRTFVCGCQGSVADSSKAKRLK